MPTFYDPETLTALLRLSRQAGGYQDVVKEVGLEPLAKTALTEATKMIAPLLPLPMNAWKFASTAKNTSLQLG